MTVSEMISPFVLADRLKDVAFSDIVQVRNRVMELRAQGETVYSFHGGEPCFLTPSAIKQALVQAAADNLTTYAPSSGILPLREAIVHKLCTRNEIHDLTAEDIIVTVGGAHALWTSFQAVLNAGDEVLIFSPYWTPIADMVRAMEARPVFVSTAESRQEGFLNLLRRHATDRTRVIYFNTPQNPSGVVFSREEVETVAAFAIERNLIVVTDEAYEDLIYEGRHVSIAALPGMSQRTISTYTFSKSYAMTGWRIGYAVAKEPFMSGLRRLVLYSTNGVTTMVQYAALAALKMDEADLQGRRAQYQVRRDLMVDGLRNLGFECALPQGAFFAFPRSQRVHDSSRSAAAILLERAHVATIPGVVFGAAGEGHLRVSYSTGVDEILRGLDALKSALA